MIFAMEQMPPPNDGPGNEGCSFGDIGCVVKDKIGGLAGDTIRGFVESIVEGTLHVLRLIGTWWMDAPGPYFDNPVVERMRDDLGYFVWAFGTLGLMLGLIRLVISAYTSGGGREAVVQMGGLIANIILAAGVYIVMVPMLLNAGDATAKWLLERSTDNFDMASLADPMAAEAFLASPGTAFLLAICMFLGSLANFLMLLLRNVLLLVLIVALPVIAAGSNSETGRQAWKKANAYLIACLLMKPTAAGIYSFGFLLMQDTGEDFGQVLSSAISGILLLFMAALVLPTLVRFLSPVVATGMGGFSGAGVAAAGIGVAAGAAILAGGAAAAGGVAARAGGAAGAGGAAARTGGPGGSGGSGEGPSSGTPGGGSGTGAETAPGSGLLPGSGGGTPTQHAPSGSGAPAAGGSGAPTAGGSGAPTAGGSGAPTAGGSGAPTEGGTPPAQGSTGNGPAGDSSQPAAGASTASGTKQDGGGKGASSGQATPGTSGSAPAGGSSGTASGAGATSGGTSLTAASSGSGSSPASGASAGQGADAHPTPSAGTAAGGATEGRSSDGGARAERKRRDRPGRHRAARAGRFAADYRAATAGLDPSKMIDAEEGEEQ